MNEDKQKSPALIPSMNEATNVHLAYIRRDIDEIKSTLSTLTSGYVTRIDFDEHLKTDEDHESRLRMLEKSYEGIQNIKSTISNLALRADVELIKKILFGGVATVLLGALAQVLFLIYK